MQRLFYAILIVCLPLIAFFQFDRYRRHHPEAVYAYQPAGEIDASYYDPEVLLQYYQRCEEIGAYGRFCWRNEKIDVLREQTTSPEAGPMVQRYQALIASAKYLEGKLIQSLKWKTEGYTNEQIRLLELGIGQQEGKVPEQLLARLGDEGAIVLAVQQQLQRQGYTLKVDGIFRSETENTLKTYQQKAGLTPSGNIDLATLQRLWQ